jgi:hypothetical protein
MTVYLLGSMKVSESENWMVLLREKLMGELMGEIAEFLLDDSLAGSLANLLGN